MKPELFICDDEASVRGALQFLFEQHGYTVRTFEDGPALLAALEAPVALRAVVVLDVRMEPISGPQVQEQMIARGLAQRFPVIFLTGHGDIPLAVAAMELGAFKFVEKPYTDDALVEQVSKACTKEAELFARAQRREELKRLLDQLSDRQRQLLPLVAAGMLNKQMADELGLHNRSIEVHRAKLYEALGLDSAAKVATFVAELRGLGIDLG
jgi:two-component system response regulator DctR